ncbi:hypothetical protein H5410_005574 [Solanum commersonii]|uniref:Uncharacterized protein n=1 Tax=Solanum commersonii TaxID=4109 RepID=A0A9J6A7X5_SOLCO|nr:hypothetical protein H5410_005574 [Solanum commersonii]
MPTNTLDVLPSWSRRRGTKAQKKCWSVIPGCIWWTILGERNSRCFQNKSNPIQNIKLNCIQLCIFGVKTISI